MRADADSLKICEEHATLPARVDLDQRHGVVAGAAVFYFREHAAPPAPQQQQADHAAVQHGAQPVEPGVAVVERDERRAAWPKHAKHFLNRALCARRVMQHAEGVHQIKARIAPRVAFRVPERLAGGEAVERKIELRVPQMLSRKIERVHARTGLRIGEVIAPQAHADFQNVSAPPACGIHGRRQPRGINLVPVSAH
jgi:hypothetical protein